MIVDNTAYRNEVVRSDELSAKGNLQKDPTFDSIRSFTYPHPRPATTAPGHQIRASPFGTFCGVCKGRLGRDKVASDTTIARHFDKNPRCLNGDRPDILNLERQLQRDFLSITSQMGNKTYSDNFITSFFGEQGARKTRKGPACSNCGRVGKLKDLNKHFESDDSTCSKANLVKRDDLLVSRNYKTSGGSLFVFPRSCLTTLTSGKYNPESKADSHHKRLEDRHQLVQHSISSMVPPVVRRNVSTLP